MTEPNEDGEHPVWRVRTGTPKTKMVLLLLAMRADAPAGYLDFEPSIAGIADATGLSEVEVKLALNQLLDEGHIHGDGVRAAGFDDTLDIEIAPGLTRSGRRRVFWRRS